MHSVNQLILELIKEPIESQVALLERLNDKGVELNQSSLSRRLKKLSIDKRNGVYEQHNKDNEIRILELYKSPPNILVAHTKPAFANALAIILDQYRQDSEEYEGLLGTIAGDDTILIITTQEYLDALHTILTKEFIE